MSRMQVAYPTAEGWTERFDAEIVDRSTGQGAVVDAVDGWEQQGDGALEDDTGSKSRIASVDELQAAGSAR